MKHKYIYWLLILWGVALFSSCNLFDTNIGQHGAVDIYLLKSWHNKANSFQILENDIEMEAEPLVSYGEIIQYDQDEYAFKLKESARNRIINLEHSGHGRAFAVTVNDSVIYTGYLWASFSSAMCDWVVIDPLLFRDNEWMQVRLGYPGYLPEFNIPDKRNDTRIIQVFREDKKLIE